MTNKMRQVIVAGLVCVICAAGALVWTGCDTASGDEALVVSPSSVVLASGQSQLFTVTGGYHYTWELSGSGSSSGTTSTAQGSLSSLNGSEVRFTAPTSDTLSGSVTLNVTSTIEGSGAGTSNSPAYSMKGFAKINFKSTTSSPPPSSETTPLSITPPTMSDIGTNGVRTFLVSGGTSPYTWTVNNNDLGSVAFTGNNATYTAKKIGTNTLTCSDAKNVRASVDIFQHL